MFLHERLGELELGLHDLESVLLEHRVGGAFVAQRLTLAHELRHPSLESFSLRCTSRLPQSHTSQC